MADHIEPILYPIGHAARRLGVSRSTVERWLRHGELRAAVVRGRRRISALEIEEFLARAEGRVTETAAA